MSAEAAKERLVQDTAGVMCDDPLGTCHFCLGDARRWVAALLAHDDLLVALGGKAQCRVTHYEGPCRHYPDEPCPLSNLQCGAPKCKTAVEYDAWVFPVSQEQST